jgi:uncharacterized membrane protein
MKKFCLYIVLILVASTLTVKPTKCYDSNSFRLIETYWGTSQKEEVSPGDVATLTVILRYEPRGSIRNLEAYLFLPDGFEPVGGGDTVNVYYSGTVSEGSLMTLELPIFITHDVEKGIHTANLSLYYSGWYTEPGDELQIPLEVTGKPTIDINVLNDSLNEGEQTVSVRLSNYGDAAAKNLKIEVASSITSTELAGVIFIGNLEFGESVIVPLSLFVKTSDIGKTLSLAIDASYLGPKNILYQASETAQLSLEEVEETGVTITTKYLEVTVEAGNAVQYPTTITNVGDIDQQLSLYVETPTDWKGVFLSDTLEVSKLYLEAKQSESLVVKITPPKTVATGIYTIPVQVLAEDGTVYAEMELKTTIVGSYSLGIESSTLLTSITAGGSTSFTVKVTNTGQSSITGVGLDVEVPTNWESSVSPIQVDVLRSSESYTFNVVAKAPGDAVTGDYMVTLTGLSDQAESSQVQVRFTVTTATEWGLYGVGVAAIFVVALVIVFLKFKRR